MTVLPDHEIIDHHENDHLPSLLDPFRPDRVEPASVDLLLSGDFRVFEPNESTFIDLGYPETRLGLTKKVWRPDQFVLHPGEFVLASTTEKVMLPSHIMARVEGKSSLARLGLIVHATAGFIDPGFEGTIALEMTNLLRIPIILRPFLPICQISFSYMNAPVDKPYSGRYQGQDKTTESRYGT